MEKSVVLLVVFVGRQANGLWMSTKQIDFVQIDKSNLKHFSEHKVWFQYRGN